MGEAVLLYIWVGRAEGRERGGGEVYYRVPIFTLV